MLAHCQIIYCQIIFPSMDRPHVNYLFIDRHLGCFYFLAIMINAAMNIHAQVFIDMLLFLLGIYLRVELLGRMIILCLTF